MKIKSNCLAVLPQRTKAATSFREKKPHIYHREFTGQNHILNLSRKKTIFNNVVSIRVCVYLLSQVCLIS